MIGIAIQNAFLFIFYHYYFDSSLIPSDIPPAPKIPPRVVGLSLIVTPGDTNF